MQGQINIEGPHTNGPDCPNCTSHFNKCKDTKRNCKAKSAKILQSLNDAGYGWLDDVSFNHPYFQDLLYNVQDEVEARCEVSYYTAAQ